MRALAVLLLLPGLRADELTQKMTARLSEEAEAFERLAPQVLGQETLHQRALKPPSHFRPRVGAAAKTAPAAVWQERNILSEYGFAAFGTAQSLHELRKVISVDGRKIEDAGKAQDALVKTITANDDVRKKQLLKQFEKYGLVGAVTDFGQLLLLFTRRELERYEFTANGQRTFGDAVALVFRYKQLDGPEALTLIEANKKDEAHRLHVEGEIWVRRNDLVPLRITLAASNLEGTTAIREEANVNYTLSPYGALLPALTEHRELRAGNVTAENKFTYANFHKFGASSDIKFEVEK